MNEGEKISIEDLENKIEDLEQMSEESFEELKDLLGSVEKGKSKLEESTVDKLI